MRTLACVVLVLVAGGTARADGTDLDRAMISAGIAKVKAKVLACGDASKAGGTVKATVKVAPDGKATATATGSSDATLNTCVAKAIETVAFDRTKNGGSFTYPFVFGTGNPAGPPDPAAAASSTDLDRAMISAGIAKVRAKVVACGDASKAGGTVKASVKVAPDGKATAIATGSSDAALNTCVGKAIETATFGKTTNGGSFTYPFVFGAPAAAPSGLGALAAAKDKLDACATKTKASGTVKVHLKLAQDGTTSDVKASGSGSAELDKCVASVLSTTTFPKGVSFTLDVGLVLPTGSTAAPAPPAPAASTALDRAMISDGIAKAKAAIAACGDGKTKGVVKLSVVVAPAGTVSSSTVTQTPDETLGKCVAGVLAKATFARTGQGGSFTYPFVF